MRKFITNRPLPTKEQIESYRNFDEVLKSFRALPKPFYQKWYFWGGGVAVITAAVTISVLVSNMQQETARELTSPDETSVTHDTLIQPPLPGRTIPFQEFSVNAEDGGAIVAESGTRITFPANAFLDENGNPVTGTVKVSFREFNDPVDFFLSGIPMDYDSAGTIYPFASAGMIEVNAEQEGKKLKVNPENKPVCEMISYQPEDRYNVYHYDPARKNWVYEGRDGIVGMTNPEVRPAKPASSDNTRKYAGGITPGYSLPDSISAEDALKQLRPAKRQSGSYIIEKVKFNIKDFSELVMYQGIKWEVASDNFESKFYDVDWDDFQLKRSDVKGIYNASLFVNDTVIRILVRPVFEGKDYDVAMEKYNESFKVYAEEMLKKSLEKEKKLEQIRKEDSAYNSRRRVQSASVNSVSSAAAATEYAVIRVFNVNNFGIINCDSPDRYPEGAVVAGTFVSSDGNPVLCAKYYLVEKKRNSIFTYQPKGYIKYNPKSENMLWGITSDNRIAVFLPGDFGQVDYKTNRHTFKMRVLSDGEAIDVLRSFIKG